MFNRNDKHIGLVAFFGAIGGILAWAIVLWRDQPPHLGVFLDAPVSLVLGAGASVVFVFLISNTDRTDRGRLIALALVAGVFWEPVWEASKALIDRENEQSQQQSAVDATQKAAELAANLPFLPESEQAKILAKIRLELQKAEQAARKIDSVTGFKKLQTASEQLLAKKEILPQREFRTLLAALDPIPGSNFMHYMSTGAIAAAGAPLFSTPARPIVPQLISSSELPQEDEIVTLPHGDATTSQKPTTKIVWFRISISDLSLVTVEVTSANTDLVAAIYEKSSFGLVEYVDDSGRNRNPKLHIRLKAGDYLLKISSYNNEDLPQFEVHSIIMADSGNESEGAQQ